MNSFGGICKAICWLVGLVNMCKVEIGRLFNSQENLRELSVQWLVFIFYNVHEKVTCFWVPTFSKCLLSWLSMMFLWCRLLTSNNMILLVIWCNKHLKIFQRLHISLTLQACAILLSLQNLLVLIHTKLHSKSWYYL